MSRIPGKNQLFFLVQNLDCILSKDRIKQARESVSKTPAIRERDWAQLCWNERWESFSVLGWASRIVQEDTKAVDWSVAIRPLRFLIGTYWSRLLLSHREWGCSLFIMFQANGSQVNWERYSWVWNCQEVGRRFTYQRVRDQIHSSKFSKANALNKKRLGACSQEETCLKFSQAKRNVKADWLVNLNLECKYRSVWQLWRNAYKNRKLP